MDQKNESKEYRFKELIRLSNRVTDYIPFPDYTYSSGPVKSDICGDIMSVCIREKDGVVEKVGIEGSACTVSRAVMVKTADMILGKKISDLSRDSLLESAIVLGFQPASNRASCAQFPSIVVLKAINQ